MITIEHSDFPWLITIPIPHAISGDGKRSGWRAELRRWMKTNDIEYCWEEMNATCVIFRVRDEHSAVLIKIKYS